MSCIKMYLDTPECLRTKAVVVSCKKSKEDGWDVETDRTPLFPEGGGQRSDKGTMNGTKILHCFEENGTVYHRTDAPFEVGCEVEIQVDAFLRRRYTQQHTGEHLLSYCYMYLFGAMNIGFHMSEDFVTIDLDRMLTEEEIEKGEALANEMVWSDLPVRIYTVNGEEMQALPLRKKNEKLTEGIRIVEIGGREYCTCCGTHFASTAQVGIIKVLEHIKYKQGCRITFACGELAMQWFKTENKELRRTAAMLSVKPEGVFEALQHKEEQTAQLHSRLRQKNALLADLYTEQLKKSVHPGESCRIAAGYAPVDGDAAKRIADQLCKDGDVLAVVFFDEGERCRYFCMAGDTCPVSCRDIAQKLNGMLNAKGGGNPKTAQGSFAKVTEEALQNVINGL